jgi:hypothetical protein
MNQTVDRIKHGINSHSEAHPVIREKKGRMKGLGHHRHHLRGTTKHP